MEIYRSKKKEGKTLKLSLCVFLGFQTKGEDVLALFWIVEGLPFPKKYDCRRRGTRKERL